MDVKEINHHLSRLSVWRSLGRSLLWLLIVMVFVFTAVAELSASPAIEIDDKGAKELPSAAALGSEPEVIITGFSPTAMAHNSTHLFVANNGYGMESCTFNPAQSTPVLRRVTLDGTIVDVLLQRCVADITEMVADEDYLYFRDGDTDLKRMPVDGGPIDTLVADTCCGGLAMDEDYLYWGQWNGGTMAIWQVEKDGAGAVEIVSFPDPDDLRIYEIAVDETHVYWVSGKTGNEVLNQPGEGMVRRVPIGGGAIQTLADSADGIENSHALALDETDVFWSELDNAMVRSVAQTGGGVTDHGVIDTDYKAGSLAVNEDHIFWADTTGGYDGRIRRVPKGGGTIDNLALGRLGPGGVFLTESYVYWGEHGGVYRLPVDADYVTVDLRITDLEVTQGLQSLDNAPVSLASGKTTYVRAYADVDLVSTEDVTARLTAYDQADAALGQVESTNPLVFVRTLGSRRFHIDDTFNFRLPSAWTFEPSLKLCVEINADATILEKEKENNIFCETFSFQEKAPLCPILVPVRVSGTSFVPTPNEVNAEILELTHILWPTSDIQHGHYETIEEAGGPFELPDDGAKLLIRLGIIQAFGIYPSGWCDNGAGRTHTVGLVHHTADTGTAFGLGSLDFSVSWIKRVGTAPNIPADLQDFYDTKYGQPIPAINWPRGGTTMAHELAHNYGRLHVDCGGPDDPDPNYPNDPCNFTEDDPAPNAPWGFDYRWINSFSSSAWTVIDAEARVADVMSYRHPRWSSKYTYDALWGLTGNVFAPTSAAATTDMVLVTGIITPTTGTAVLADVYHLHVAQLTPEKMQEFGAWQAQVLDSSGRYALEFLDRRGDVLVSYPFQPAETNEGLSSQAFAIPVQYLPETDSLRFTLEGIEIASREVSKSAPVVQVLSPNGGEALTTELAISWQAVDGDGDPLSYVVQYSGDNGDSWQVIGSDIYTTNLLITDTTTLPGSINQSLVRVAANDGFNTGLDSSDAPFSLDRHKPTAYITTPDEDAVLRLGQELILKGLGWDAEDGTLDDSALSWYVDGIPAGTGEEVSVSGLSAGAHSIRLRATDSDGMFFDERIYITLTGDQCPVHNNRVDIVFLFDTSSSMALYYNEIEAVIPGAISLLEAFGLDVRYSQACTMGMGWCTGAAVQSIDPATAVNHPSDWGAGVISLAQRYPWLDGYTRLIVPVVTQGPEDGHPIQDPGSDRDTLTAAADAAVKNGTAVAPLVAPLYSMPPAPDMLILGDDLAKATGGVVMDWSDPLLNLGETLLSLKSKLGCGPDVAEVTPTTDVDQTMIISVQGTNLWPGTQVYVGRWPAREVTYSADASLITFRLPFAVSPAKVYDVILTRPGAGSQVIPDALETAAALLHLGDGRLAVSRQSP